MYTIIVIFIITIIIIIIFIITIIIIIILHEHSEQRSASDFCLLTLASRYIIPSSAGHSLNLNWIDRWSTPSLLIAGGNYFRLVFTGGA